MKLMSEDGMVLTCVVLLLLSFNVFQVNTASWTEWWSYDGISGQRFWGLINGEWIICNTGKRQSPINIRPESLLYDPSLNPVWIDKQRVNGMLENTGTNLRVSILHQADQQHVNFTGGPLAYKYRVHSVLFHYGLHSSNGSEHSIDHFRFPMEIQIVGYNSDIYGNFTHAAASTNGLSIISLLVKESRKTNPELDIILKALPSVTYRGQQTPLKHISMYGLIPHTDHFITYEGSLTQPGCQETVTWIIYNKPVYVSREHLQDLRELMRTEGAIDEDNNNNDNNKDDVTTDTPAYIPFNGKVELGDNYREAQESYNRPIRTNINFENEDAFCDMNKKMYYQSSFPNG